MNWRDYLAKERHKSNNKPKLSDRQKSFIEEYLIDFNATQAALRAGYAEKGVSATASQLLANPKVNEYYQKRLAERKEQVQYDQAFIIQDCLELLQADFTKNGNGRHNKFIQDITVIKKEDGSTVTKLKFRSKDKAANLLAKAIGMDRKDLNINIKTIETEIEQAKEADKKLLDAPIDMKLIEGGK